MKKNFAMRIAACLLVVTMLSLCMVSYTYAKYTTQNDSENVAQVAKWGVTVTAKLDDLFEQGYINGPEAVTDNTAIVLTSGTLENAKNMLAPGTTDNQASALVVTGAPEVAVDVDYTLTVELTGWEITVGDAPEAYMPIVLELTIDGTTYTYKMGATASSADNTYVFTDVAELCAAVAAQVDELDDDFVEANSDLAHTINLKWTWDFEGAEGGYQTDVKDTALGNLTTAPTFKVTIGATVTQVN